MTRGAFRLRRARPTDRRALYRICLLTGDAGENASGLYADTALLGHLYVGPYLALEPEHALVALDPQGRVCGYAVGALDTVAFHRRVRASWLPALQRRYPDPGGDPDRFTPDQRLTHLLHHPDAAFPLSPAEPLAPFPSHLHLDLLPHAQGRGLGRALMERLLARLRQDGSSGVHLGVDARNRRAVAFYRHLGFARVGPQDATGDATEDATEDRAEEQAEEQAAGATGASAVWMTRALP